MPFLITEPTRVTVSSQTTIDHIISNEAHFKVQPAVLQCKITDHHAILCSISEFAPNAPKKFIQNYFDHKTFDADKFCNNLEISLNNNFAIGDNEIDANVQFHIFTSIVCEILFKHAPKNPFPVHKNEKIANLG